VVSEAGGFYVKISLESLWSDIFFAKKLGKLIAGLSLKVLFFAGTFFKGLFVEKFVKIIPVMKDKRCFLSRT
jgi:hypothetical protein